jgi:hypothetical protein
VQGIQSPLKGFAKNYLKQLVLLGVLLGFEGIDCAFKHLKQHNCPSGTKMNDLVSLIGVASF